MATLSNAEKRFLNQLIASVKRPLNLAWLLTIFNTALFIWQAWLLASLFSTWLNNYFNKLPLMTEVNSLWLAGLITCFILRPLLNLGRELLGMRASLKVRRTLRQSLLLTMAKLGPNLRHYGSDGSISSQMIDQTDALDGFIIRFSVQKKVAATTPIMLLMAVATQSWFAAILLLVTAPLVPIFMILIGHLTARKSAKQFMALAQLSGRFLDWVRGMPTLKRLQATNLAQQDLAISSEDYRRRTMDVLKIAFLNGAVLELLAALSIALVAVYLGFGLMGILPWDKGHIPVPYFGALFILLLAPEFYTPLRQLGADYHAKAQAEGAAQSLLPIINAAEQSIGLFSQSLNETATPTRQKDDLTELDLSKPFGLKLNKLTIKSPIINSNKSDSSDTNTATYRTRLAPVNAEIKAEERIALVGDSGTGKSSLLQALMGFVNFSGDINLVIKQANQELVVPFNEINHNQLRHNIGYLAQQVALMPLTIADNLRLAKPNAKENELIEALKEVGLWDLIARLPDGLNTQLGDRGQGLSGGQQQRLGIAQLLLRNDSLWLLDEPTEHLDPDTAERIHTLLEKVSRGKTVIWITHSVEQLEWLDSTLTLVLPPVDQKPSFKRSNTSNSLASNKQTLSPEQGGKL